MTDDLRNGPLAYVATPYSKYPAGIGEAFIEAAKLTARLLRAHINAYSPIAHTHPIAVYGDIDPFDHSIWLTFDRLMLDRCDVLIVAHLEGWEHSQGIEFEVAYFERVRKPIFDLDPVSLQLTRRKIEKPPRQRADGWTDEQIAADRAEWLGDALNKAGHCHRLAHSKSPSEQGGASV